MVFDVYPHRDYVCVSVFVCVYVMCVCMCVNIDES